MNAEHTIPSLSEDVPLLLHIDGDGHDHDGHEKPTKEKGRDETVIPVTAQSSWPVRAVRYVYNNKTFFLTLALLFYSLCASVMNLLRANNSLSWPLFGSSFGVFPRPGDPLHFLPCTNATQPPPLDHPDPAAFWAERYEPDPTYWSWGPTSQGTGDAAAARGIFLCGYLDVPRDWTNATDVRIMRLAVTRYQVRGPAADAASERTLVVAPPHAGSSGTGLVWRSAPALSARLTGSTLDVLSWDARGANASQPQAVCSGTDNVSYFPTAHPAGRSAIEIVTSRTLKELMHKADSLNREIFLMCAQQLGDLGRFVNTGQTALDLEAVRVALGEKQLTTYLASDGALIGQTYAGMFPERVGHMVLDGPQLLDDDRYLASRDMASLGNATALWRDGFLDACITAGPDHCALAAPLPAADDNGDDGDDSGTQQPETVASLDFRMTSLFDRIAKAAIVSVDNDSHISYATIVSNIYAALYRPSVWPALAQLLADLESDDVSFFHTMLANIDYPTTGRGSYNAYIASVLSSLVVCSDISEGYPEYITAYLSDLDWWHLVWINMTDISWIAGNSRFYDSLACHHFSEYWPYVARLFRVRIDAQTPLALRPLLVIGTTHDPAAPLHNARRLATTLGPHYARLVVHHGFGHTSVADPSSCTDAIIRHYLLTGALPDPSGSSDTETHCYADTKPFQEANSSELSLHHQSLLTLWQEHMYEMVQWAPGLRL